MKTRRAISLKSVSVALSVSAASLLLCPQAALAQSQPSRPSNGGVYGGSGQTPRDSLAATVSVYGAEDSELSGGNSIATDAQGVPLGEPYSGTDVTLAYLPGRRGAVDLDFRGASGFRYYPGLSEAVAATQSATVGVGVGLTRRTALHTRGGLSYSPYLDYSQPVGLDGNAAAAPERIRDNRVASRRSLSYDGTINYTFQKSNRTAMMFLYGVRRTQLLDESQSALDSTLSAGLSRRVSRTSTARLNYVFRDGVQNLTSAATPIRLHDVELGYDLDLAHSPTRRTTIAFSGGPSFVEYQGRQSIRTFGGVALTHPFTRSWSLRAFYRRGVTFLDGSNQPFLSDSMSIGLAGLVTRRLDVSVTAGAILGDIGIEAGVAAATPYDTYTGSSRVRFGLTNSMALFAEYLATYSRYNGGAAAAAGLNRGGLRFGLSLYVPIVRDLPPAPGNRGGARR
jgi:hypothetical protein